MSLKGPPFTILKTLRFLSLRYSADFGRSRLVFIFLWFQKTGQERGGCCDVGLSLLWLRTGRLPTHVLGVQEHTALLHRHCQYPPSHPLSTVLSFC